MKKMIFGLLFSLFGLVGPLAAQGVDPNPVRLPYKLTRFQGSMIPVFTGWHAQPVKGFPGTQAVTLYPRNSQDAGFAVSIILAPPGSQIRNNFPAEGKRYIQMSLSRMQKLGQPRTIHHSHGSQVLIVDQDVRNQGMALTVRTIYAMKQNHGMILMAFYNQEGFRKYGQALDILLARISVQGKVVPGVPRPVPDKRGKISPKLVGRWVYEYITNARGTYGISSSTRTTITISANETYTWHSVTIMSTGHEIVDQERGTVEQQGNQLVFTPSKGKSWKNAFRPVNGGIWFGRNLYTRE